MLEVDWQLHSREDKMLDESSDFYLSDSSSTTSSTTVLTNNTSGDEPENNNQSQLYSLITLHPSTDNVSPHHNHLVTTDIEIISGLNSHHQLLANLNPANDHNSSSRLTTLTQVDLKDTRCANSDNPTPSTNSLISVDIIGSSTTATTPCTTISTNGCDKMLAETVSVTNGRMDNNSNQEVTTTTVVNGNGEVVDIARKKNPVGRRKLVLSAREKTLRRLESNERERLRMHSLNQAFQVKIAFLLQAEKTLFLCYN